MAMNRLLLLSICYEQHRKPLDGVMLDYIQKLYTQYRIIPNIIL